MEVRKEIYEGITIHAIKTDKFKRCLCSVLLFDNVRKEEMTKRVLLHFLLDDSTKKYPSNRDLSIKYQDLYGSYDSSSISYSGNYSHTELSIYFLNPKYSDKKELKNNIDLLFDVLYDPNIKDNKFDQTSFDKIVNYQKNRIKSQYENKNIYAYVNALNVINNQMASSFSNMGYLEDFDNITSSSLVDYYNEFFNQETHIVFVGNINLDEVIETIKTRISKDKKYPKIDFKPITQKKVSEPKIIIEEAKNNQSELVVGLTTHDLTKREDDVVMPIYNAILGSGPESLLFLNVREKKSLCYSIRSRYRSKDNLIIIQTSIALENYESVVQEIKNSLLTLSSGKFTMAHLNIVKRLMINSIKSIDDSIFSIFRTYISITIFDAPEKKEMIEMIKSVTKEEIINLSKKINLDTIYLLSAGGKNGKV